MKFAMMMNEFDLQVGDMITMPKRVKRPSFEDDVLGAGVSIVITCDSKKLVILTSKYGIQKFVTSNDIEWVTVRMTT